MYAIEKSSRNADVTSTIAANSTAPNAAIPARRAVSPRRIEPVSRTNKARMPARNEYELRPSANRSAKLPIWDIGGNPEVFFQINDRSAIHVKPRSACCSGILDSRRVGQEDHASP